MSGVVKGVKKVFKGATKLVKKVASGVAKGVRKIAKSKVFKIALMAGAIYFGGAGLMSLANKGTFMQGVTAAGTSLSSAGSSLLKLDFAGAGSNLVAGIKGTTVAAQTAAQAGLSAAGSIAGSGGSTVINGVSGAVGGTGGATINGVTGALGGGITPAASGLSASGTIGSNIAGNTVNGFGSGLMSNVLPTALPAAAPAAGMTVGQGLMASAGINAVSQGAGGFMNAKAGEAAAEDQRDRYDSNMRGKANMGNYRYNIQSAFTPQTTNDQRRG